jgi:hypothetical protein
LTLTETIPAGLLDRLTCPSLARMDVTDYPFQPSQLQEDARSLATYLHRSLGNVSAKSLKDGRVTVAIGGVDPKFLNTLLYSGSAIAKLIILEREYIYSYSGPRILSIPSSVSEVHFEEACSEEEFEEWVRELSVTLDEFDLSQGVGGVAIKAKQLGSRDGFHQVRLQALGS